MRYFRKREAALLSLSFLFFIAASMSASSAAVLTVGPGEMYTVIQDAIDDAAPGDTIQVRAGTYVEDIEIVTNELTLVSADGAGLAVVEGAGGSPDVIGIRTGFGVTIDGFRILPGTAGMRGIYHRGGSPHRPDHDHEQHCRRLFRGRVFPELRLGERDINDLHLLQQHHDRLQGRSLHLRIRRVHRAHQRQHGN